MTTHTDTPDTLTLLDKLSKVYIQVSENKTDGETLRTIEETHKALVALSDALADWINLYDDPNMSFGELAERGEMALSLLGE